MQLRKQEEIEFHNRRETHRESEEFEKHYPNQRFYNITKRSQSYRDSWIAKLCSGKRVLDYCCGNGELSCLLAEAGAEVIGVDISGESIAAGKERAKKSGLEGLASFRVMDAENLEFPENSFDAVICCGVLHHLELHIAYSQIAKVLKPGGSALCIESLSHNPFIHKYRKITPHLRTSWEVDHILNVARIQEAKDYFGLIDIHYFHLADLAAIAFIDKPGFKWVLAITNFLDSFLTRIPYLQRWSWQAIFTLSNPKNLNG